MANAAPPADPDATAGTSGAECAWPRSLPLPPPTLPRPLQLLQATRARMSASRMTMYFLPSAPSNSVPEYLE